MRHSHYNPNEPRDPHTGEWVKMGFADISTLAKALTHKADGTGYAPDYVPAKKANEVAASKADTTIGRQRHENQAYYADLFIESRTTQERYAEEQRQLSPIPGSQVDTTPDEQKALTHYGGSVESFRINKMLRGTTPAQGTPWPTPDMSVVPTLDALIAKTRTTEDRLVYRGILAESAEKLEKGTVFRDKAFVSTSRSQDVGERFAQAPWQHKPGVGYDESVPGVVLEITVPKGSQALDVTHSLEADGRVGPAEGEVLLPRDTTFEITGEASELDQDGNRVLTATVVHPDTEVSALSGSLIERAFINVMARKLDPYTLALAAAGTPPDFGELEDAAHHAVNTAAGIAIRHAHIVMVNNPDATPAELFSRDDVSDALTLPFYAAEEAVNKSAALAWQAGRQAGWQAASEELDALGLDLGEAPPDDSYTFTALAGDAKANAAQARVRIEQALMDGGPDEAKKVRADLARRAAYTVQAAGMMAQNEAKAQAYADHPGVGKMWVCHFNPGTCEHCAGLHGMVVPVGAEFPHNTGTKYLAVYNGQLFGPPRHPNCRCTLAPHFPGHESSTSPDTLQAYGLQHGAKEDNTPPGFISAASLRAIPKRGLTRVLDWLLRRLRGGSAR